MNPDSDHIQNRVLLLAPTARDGETTRRILADAGISCSACPQLSQLCEGLSQGAAAAILPEEALTSQELPSLVTLLAAQPPWSDLPIVVLARHGADSPISKYALERLGNVILLERPVRINTLVSAAWTALRARRRQYQLRDYLHAQQQSEQSLRKAELALREADRRKDEFLATLAHELRNPLAAVRNAVQVLQLSHHNGPEDRWCREVIERQVQHLTRLIDDLLDISRITRNKLELRKQRVALQDVVNAAVEESRPMVDQYGHRLTVMLPDEPIYLRADLVRLAQAIANLLNNAAKYTDRGGEILLHTETQKDEVVVRVKDTGMGIPADKLDHLFELFFQVEPSIMRGDGGLGIGLALVRTLVEMHGGSVDAFSEGKDKGSEFVLRLPVLAETAALPQVRKTDSQLDEPAAKRRILVVDDNRDSADSLSLALRVLGHEVHTTYSGSEAVECARDVHPEVVLMDIGMPKMNGYEAAERIRAQGWGNDPVIVAVSGWGQDVDRERSRQAAFNAHLVKPVSIDNLVQVLAQHSQAPGSTSAAGVK